MNIVIASANHHKVREFRFLLSAFPYFEVSWLSHYPQIVLPEENKNTFSENAAIKALAMAKETNSYAIADDSGLIVPALNGEPGIFSRRYAGNDATDSENVKKLLNKMARLEGEERFAFFECSISLASPQGVIKTATATCEGYILENPRGSFGFGYDSLFVKHDYDKTFAEVPESVKNRISHRFKAFERLVPTLQALH